MRQALCECLRQCGRSASLFALAFIVVLACGLFWETGGSWILFALVVVGVVHATRAVLAQRENRWEYAHFPRLAPHDWRAARNRLTHGRTQPLPRAGAGSRLRK